MLQNTQGIVLRNIPFGETSVIATLFTQVYGVQSYLIKGVRTAKRTGSKMNLLQPGMMLDLSTYHIPNKNMQHLREFYSAYVHQSFQEDIIKNTVTLFSIEVLLRLLPEHAPMPDLFDFSWEYLQAIDRQPTASIGNYALFFITKCSSILGYELQGSYSEATPYLDVTIGGYTMHPPSSIPHVTMEDGAALQQVLAAEQLQDLGHISLSSTTRMRLTEWYIAYLQSHSQHMGAIRCLPILHTILHH
jgi:DNA repair protein RecO (recombination protein O)